MSENKNIEYIVSIKHLVSFFLYMTNGLTVLPTVIKTCVLLL